MPSIRERDEERERDRERRRQGLVLDSTVAYLTGQIVEGSTVSVIIQEEYEIEFDRYEELERPVPQEAVVDSILMREWPLSKRERDEKLRIALNRAKSVLVEMAGAGDSERRLQDVNRMLAGLTPAPTRT